MRTHTDDAWIEELIVELRLRRVSGPDIGDAVASVRELLADSGQSAEEAFGPARAYAASLPLPREATDGASTYALPLLGLIAFLAFTHAGTAWFAHESVRFSLPQLALLALPVLLSLTLPLYLSALIRHRWIALPLVVLAGAGGALSTLFAPASDAEAWIASPPLPWLVGAGAAMIVLAVAGTARSLRRRATDEIVEPLGRPAGRAHGWHPAFLLIHWIFPVFAAFFFLLSWVLQR